MTITNESKIILYIDGASRNNPGLAGAGICIKKKSDLLLSRGFFLGSKTNNEAEYLALILGLFYVQNYLTPKDLLEIISDSELLVRQISGIYKIKKPELKKMHILAMSILNNLSYVIRHIPREQNKEADKKANQAIDNKLPLDQEFIIFLHDNDILFDF